MEVSVDTTKYHPGNALILKYFPDQELHTSNWIECRDSAKSRYEIHTSCAIKEIYWDLNYVAQMKEKNSVKPPLNPWPLPPARQYEET